MRCSSGETLKEIDLYFEDIKDSKPLSRKEEAEIGKRIAEGDTAAINRLVEANLKFVVSVAKNYIGKGVSFPDLISEGNLGLIHAAKKFDYTKGYKFISYAVWWIRRYIEDFVTANEQRVEGSENEDWDPHHADTHRDVIHSDKMYDDLDECVNDYMTRKIAIDDLVECLNARERKIIEMYFGLGGEDKIQLCEIGKEMKMSTERVRQLVNTSMEKMRFKAMESGEFESYQSLA